MISYFSSFVNRTPTSNRGRKNRLCSAIALCALALICTTASPAAAQHDTTFSIEHFRPSVVPGRYFEIPSADGLAQGAITSGAVFHYQRTPLVIRDSKSGDTLGTPVRDRMTADLSVAMGIPRGWTLGVALPIVTWQTGDRLQGLGVFDEEPLASSAVGDLRIEAFRVIRGRPRSDGSRRQFALSETISLPTGNQNQFAGDRGFVFDPRVLYEIVHPTYSVALTAGLHVRSFKSEFFDETLGDAAVFGVGASRAQARSGGGSRLFWVGEFVGFAPIEGSGVSGELRGGARIVWAHNLEVGIGGGVGLAAELGAPAFRALLDIRYRGGGSGRDSDSDGVNDVCDRCRFVPEDLDGFQDRDGCPDLDDDSDDVPDSEDECPRVAEDRDNWRDTDGCPEVGE